MDIQFYGANCVTLATKQARVVVDDNLADLGAKSITKEGDISLHTMPHGDPNAPSGLVFGQPGEYEAAGVSIFGIAARAHIDEEKQMNATMYKVVADDVSVLVTGHVYPELSDEQLEAIGTIDVMIVPVGGHGYTLDAIGALKLIKKVEPKLVIPTHYDDAKLTFEVPAQPLDEALQSMSMQPKETAPKLRVKHSELGETTQLVVLERS
ncbi:MAG TPA: MBL fold metallo-hydrolase [Patescibacteria group bacterium]|nr:MBL fold metallo-hydrolase [Patescibacteria group bacterium]